VSPSALRLATWVLIAVTFLVGIDNLDRSLANPDEGRYSEISREMVATGDWVTPRLNGLKYFEKPPLQYWGSAVALAIFGNHEFAARLYVSLCGLATILLVGFTGARLMGKDAGYGAMLVLLSAPYFMALGGVVTLDMGLTLWTTATLCAYMLAESAPDSRSRRNWLMGAWAAMALAVLSKGLVGIVFPGAALFLHCLIRRDFTPVMRLEWGYGLVVFLAIAAPWFVAVSYANPEFAEFFFIHEHFTRFLTTTHRRTEPWWYFLPLLFAGFLPWMFALPAAINHAWRADGRTAGAQPVRLAILFSVFVVAFFSASGSKLPAYILPVFPMLALVLGRYLTEAPPPRLVLWTLPTGFVAVALGVAAWQAPGRAHDAWNAAMYLESRPYAVTGAAILLAAGVAAPLLMRRGRRWMALLVVAIGTQLMIDCIEDAYEAFAPRQSGRVVAEKMRPLLKPGTRLYSVGIYDQTLPFYIGRTLKLVNYVDEFALGIKAQPELHLATLDEFRADWVRPGEALAIMHPDTYQDIRSRGLPMQLVHEDPRRVLVRKP
jgi:4-amino-4-deoxy-L-arabinose transferase-like glycosyltransferase